MKKLSLIMCCICIIAITSCKKDRVCECTTVSTDSSGNVDTNPQANTTYKDIRKSDAKSLCQKSTSTRVSSSGATSTYVSDCKLK